MKSHDMTLVRRGLLAMCLVLAPGCTGRSMGEGADGALPDLVDPNREIGKCCYSPAECSTGHCTNAPLLALQICSKLCTSNQDCPWQSACQRIGDGSGGYYSVCLPCEIVANTNERYCPTESGTFNCF